MGPRLEALATRKGTFRIRKIDIDTWRSPVARQYTVRKLPTLLLYDGDELVSENTSEVLQALQR